MEISQRANSLLQELIEAHVSQGLPVGSKLLAQTSALNVSAATIRNIMAELEEAGLIAAPHTSAGRIPTESGYRAYVDTLLLGGKLAPNEKSAFASLEADVLGANPQGAGDLLKSASSILSNVTQMAGVVVTPFQESFAIEQIEFIPLAQNRVLAVLVFSNQEIENRVFETERLYSAEELKRAAYYITQHYKGSSLSSFKSQLVTTMRGEKAHMDEMMQSVLDLASRSLNSGEGNEKDLVVAGESHLLSMLDTSNVERLQGLFDAFTQKRDILHLLEACDTATGIQIFIGSESQYAPLNDCSIVSAPYGKLDEGGEPLGVLAVIGPTRMNYQKAISTVNLTAKILGKALTTKT